MITMKGYQEIRGVNGTRKKKNKKSTNYDWNQESPHAKTYMLDAYSLSHMLTILWSKTLCYKNKSVVIPFYFYLLV